MSDASDAAPALSEAEREALKEEKKAKKAAEKAAKLAKLEAKKAKQAKQRKAAEANKDKKAEEAAKAKAAKEAAAAAFVNTTPEGEYKQLDKEMAAAYSPKAVEAAWYAWWDKQGYFAPLDERKDARKFVIVIPPPNVTGSLHLGHALTNAVQDTLVRWRRMCGDDVLWVPGTDHAGIATQRVVERRLWQDKKQTRHDLGREKFLELAWQWKEKYGSYIFKQLRLLGSSLDWNREAFTMDDNLSAAVTSSFIQFFDEGLIYRADRLVNWCCELETAISDIEVDYIEKPTQLKVPGHDESKRYPFGVLVHFAYKVVGDDGNVTDDELVVATTRIETMLGDTAVAVHPDDERYKKLHGKKLQHPFCDRVIPIITDSELVDMNFGTGAVKITPAHDPNDYRAGKRNNLEFITMLNKDGTMNDICGQFKGMKRFDARLAVIEALKEKGLHRGETPNPMRLGLCSRSKDVIEPLMCPQWWVDCKDMAADAAQCVRDKTLEIVPESHEQTWFQWLDNIQDWCISRQLWWGHRVPAYVVSIDGKELDGGETKSWVAAASEAEALEKAAKAHNVSADRITLRQDPDVLDTWYSSGLFPFSVFGWPRETADMSRFFPTSVLETGHDILFFWVARMVMMSRRLTGKLPFKRVLLHAMVRDAHNRKMSKSLGNVIDPMDVMNGITLEGLHEQLRTGNLPPSEVEKAIEGQKADFPNGIPECGADALRFGLCAYMSQGRSINLDVNRVAAYRNFCNKLWNVTRFAMLNLPDDFVPLSYKESAERDVSKLHILERWMLSRIHVAAEIANKGLTDFNLGDSVQAIYSLWYNELCDVFLEAIKPILRGEDAEGAPLRQSIRETLYTTLETGLRLLHCFMPFVTEELWQRLARRPDEPAKSIMMAAYPRLAGADPEDAAAATQLGAHVPPRDEAAEAMVALALDVTSAVRSARTEYNLTRKQPTPLALYVPDAAARDALAAMLPSIAAMSTSDEAALGVALNADKAPAPLGTVCIAVTADVEARVQLGALVDVDALIAAVEGKLAKAAKRLAALQAKMEKPTYEKAADIAKERDAATLREIEAEIAKHNASIANFRKFKDAK